MTERLTAFEFIPLTDGPQLVRVLRSGLVVMSFNVQGWLGVSLHDHAGLWFADRSDLAIEGQGIGRPYWDDDVPDWVTTFDIAAEQHRIAAIKTAMRRHLGLTHAPVAAS
jgi:hypothetical protein